MRTTGSSALAFSLGAVLVVLLVLPLVSLAVAASPADVRVGLESPLFLPALALSVRTTLLSLGIIVLTGTPLAWWLATSASRTARVVELIVDLPIVIPPAVIGVALLQTFGRQGLLGAPLDRLGLGIPFTERAVLLAQIVVSAPFFVQAAANAFRKVDPDVVIVARTLGASPARAFLRVAIPIARPGLVVGASLAWARALGEFGATLLFAGNLPGRTQTMPLAILSALESDVRVAIVFSLVLAALGTVLLIGLRLAPSVWANFAGRPGSRLRPATPHG
jgi:molybdate transport system permease protein